MSERITRSGSLFKIRVIVTVAGVLIIILAFAVDRLGIGRPGSLGFGQLMLALIGLIGLLIGVFGRKFPVVYRGLSIVILNTLLLLGLIELGAIVFARSIKTVELENLEQLPYYASQSWTGVYWHEARAAENYQYKPYVIWRHLPFEGKTINFSQEGIRETPGAKCAEGALKVFTFGGSTMLGWGAPDWGTIPAYLQQGLADRMDRPVCVVNFAEDGYVSTQSLIALILQLQNGNIPDLAVFYSGVNETLAAYESRIPGAHVTMAKIASLFEQREHPLVSWLKSSRTFALLANSIDNPMQSTRSSEIEIDELANSVTHAYFKNYEILQGLSNKYGFRFCFFWQPHIVVPAKSLTNDELRMREEIDPDSLEITTAIYQKIAETANQYENFWYIADVFDGQEKQIWIDAVGHVTPEGNLLIAQEILAKIEIK